MEGKATVSRRNVLKTVGGITATAAVGGLAANTAFGAHNSTDAIRLNQLGYPTDAHKMAIVSSAGVDVSSVSNYEVVDAETGSSVTSGSLSAAATDGWATSQEIKRADFSDLTTPGTYKLVVGQHESYPFEVGPASEVYGDALIDVGRLYTLKRANVDVTDPITGLDTGPGHLGPNGDDNATIAAPTSGDWLEDYSAGDEIDVSGGWYDAGDYGKYVITTGLTASQMMVAYDRNPEVFEVGQFQIPDSIDDPNVGTMPDVLAEARWGIDFLLKMQRPNGSLFYKVSGKNWPDDATAPSDDTEERFVFGCSSAGTAHGAGTFAMAARVFQGHDDQFAATCEQAARDAWNWLQNNPNVVFHESDGQDGGSGRYGRADQDGADRYWAAAELYRTTGEQQFLDAVNSGYETSVGGSSYTLPSADAAAPIDWNNPLHLGNLALANTSEFSAADSAPVGGLRSSYWVSQRYESSYDPYDAYTTGLYDFYWGSAKSGVSRAVTGNWGMEFGPDWMSGESHAAMIWGPVHRVFGRSATGYSFVTGHGEKSTENPHDRMVQSTGTLIPGMLIGGPHQQLYSGLQGDCSSDHIPEGTSPGESYVDEHCSYAINEWAINYTAPLFMALADLVESAPSLGDDQNVDTPTPTPDECTAPQAATPVAGNNPRDIDGDGQYKDINGNCRLDSDDVVTYFEEMENPAVADNTGLYDYNNNDRIDFDDVVTLFESI